MKTGVMRDGVTLLITLSVIAAMISLIGVLFGYLDNAREKALFGAAETEASLIYCDIYKALKKKIGSDPKKDLLQKLYSAPLSVGGKEGESLRLSCRPCANRINISWLAEHDKKRKRQNDLAEKLFEYLCNDAELRDPSLLRHMITDAVEAGGGYGGKKGIITLDGWRVLRDRYSRKAEDENIYKIKWSDYFCFGAKKDTKGKIDSEFISAKLLAFLYELDPRSVEADFTPGNLEAFLRSYGLSRKEYKWLFSKKALPIMRCNADFSYGEAKYKVSFDYIGGKVDGFEFFKNNKNNKQ